MSICIKDSADVPIEMIIKLIIFIMIVLTSIIFYREKLIKIENQLRQNSFEALDAYRDNINGNNN